jgi:hypothetical protein
MPPRRIFRRKQRTEPMSPFIWRFFLAESVQDFDQLAAVEGDNGGVFFLLYYDDGWRNVYAQHREEIEAEWSRRGWTRKQKQFVLTDYSKRGFVLAHDRRSEQKMAWWREWEAREGWKTESFLEYLERRQKSAGRRTETRTNENEPENIQDLLRD